MNADAQPLLSAGSDEALIAQEFMVTRRLQIIEMIARIFGALFSLFVLFYILFFAWKIPDTQRTIAWIAVIVLLACVGLFFTAAQAAAKKRIEMATTSILLAVDIASIWFLFFWSTILGHKGDPFTLIQFVSLSITIMLAGSFGSARLAFATTLLMNGVTLAIGLAYCSAELGFFLITGILQQWAVATFAVVTASSYRRNLRELSLAYAHTRQLDELKERFITNVNHELRTPVMTVLGYIDYLQRTWQALPPERLTRAFQKARDVGEQLMQLIESILDIRHIDERRVENLEPVALRESCIQALNLVDSREARLAGRSISIEIPEEVTVWAEAVRVQQVLMNLLSNAGKYSPPGTPIEVAAQILPKSSARNRSRQNAKEEQEMVEMSVRDHGFGIPPDQISLLFNRFVRLPRDLASSTVGNGLGLYVCRALVTALQGYIWVESTGVNGEGSTFYVQLPLCQVGAVQEALKLPSS